MPRWIDRGSHWIIEGFWAYILVSTVWGIIWNPHPLHAAWTTLLAYTITWGAVIVGLILVAVIITVIWIRRREHRWPSGVGDVLDAFLRMIP